MLSNFILKTSAILIESRLFLRLMMVVRAASCITVVCYMKVLSEVWKDEYFGLKVYVNVGFFPPILVNIRADWSPY